MSKAAVKYQEKNIEKGRCASCGAKRKHYARLCDQHQKKSTVRHRTKQGSSPWQKGKPGRPPIVK